MALDAPRFSRRPSPFRDTGSISVEQPLSGLLSLVRASAEYFTLLRLRSLYLFYVSRTVCLDSSRRSDSRGHGCVSAEEENVNMALVDVAGRRAAASFARGIGDVERDVEAR